MIKGSEAQRFISNPCKSASNQEPVGVNFGELNMTNLHYAKVAFNKFAHFSLMAVIINLSHNDNFGIDPNFEILRLV